MAKVTMKQLVDAELKCGQLPIVNDHSGCGESDFKLWRRKNEAALQGNEFNATCNVCGAMMPVTIKTYKAVTN